MDLGAFEAALPVQDLKRTTAFYEGVRFVREGGDIEVGVAELRRGDCRVCLYQGQLDPDRLQLIFWQGDIDAIAAMVEAAGIPFFRGPNKADDGGGSFMLLDPDGHPLFFIFMPVHFINHPGHEQVAPPRKPTLPFDPDMTLGWFALGLPVSDIRRSYAFYKSLGFRPTAGSLDARHITLQNRDARIALYQGYLEPPDEPQLIFWQGDVRATAAEMSAAGAVRVGRFENGPVESKEKHVACFLRDPDGQPIYLINIPGETLGQPSAV
jgi:catechol 2,3-dioxygenase-like lactoylglutathione lyase family enzyme